MNAKMIQLARGIRRRMNKNEFLDGIMHHEVEEHMGFEDELDKGGVMLITNCSKRQMK